MRMSGDTYVLTGKNTGIGATGDDVMADLYKRAEAHCGRQQRVEVVRSETRGPGLAQFPQGRLEYRCK